MLHENEKPEREIPSANRIDMNETRLSGCLFYSEL